MTPHQEKAMFTKHLGSGAKWLAERGRQIGCALVGLSLLTPAPATAETTTASAGRPP